MNGLREYLSRPQTAQEEKRELMAAIRQAERACERIQDVITDEREIGSWERGRAEGSTITRAEDAGEALMRLRHLLTIRLDWPEPEGDEPDA